MLFSRSHNNFIKYLSGHQGKLYFTHYLQILGDVCLSCPRVLMLTVPRLGKSSCPRAPSPRVSELRVLLYHFLCPFRDSHVPESTRLPVCKSLTHTSLVHKSLIHASNVTVPVPLLVTAHCSLRIYTNTTLYATN